MGEYINIGDGIAITIFSMIMVFIVLIIIAVFISMLKNLDKKKEEISIKSQDIKSIKVEKNEKRQIETQGKIKNIENEELIAVISAALAASQGVSVPQINIKSINRINNNSTAWSIAGRQEQLYNKLQYKM